MEAAVQAQGFGLNEWGLLMGTKLLSGVIKNSKIDNGKGNTAP